MAGAIIAQQFSQVLDVEFAFGNDAPVRCTRHRRQHGSEPCVASEHFHDQNSFVRSGRGAEAIRQFNRATDTGAKADAIISARDVIVHRLGYCDDLDAFLVQAGGKRKRVVAADRNQIFNTQPLQVLDNFGSEIVLLLIVGCAQRLRHILFFHC